MQPDSLLVIRLIELFSLNLLICFVVEGFLRLSLSGKPSPPPLTSYEMNRGAVNS
jgi:hypothetical protein